jgi:hypothetical protein
LDKIVYYCYSMATQNNLVPVSEVDYLEADPPLRGQNYVCLSFISPEDVIVKKEHFFFERFTSYFTKEMNELFDGLSVRYPKDKDNLRLMKDRYPYLFNENAIGDEFNFYVGNHQEKLQKEYDEKNNFQTSIRGIKVRGVFDTLREAQIRAEVLKKLDGKFHVYVAEIGVWCPWSPNPDDIPNQEYNETQLNTLMKHYKDNQTKKDVFYQERKNELQFLKVKKDIESDTWVDRKEDEAGASSSAVIEDITQEVPTTVPDIA